MPVKGALGDNLNRSMSRDGESKCQESRRLMSWHVKNSKKMNFTGAVNG